MEEAIPRDRGVDLVKTLAIFGVLLVHVGAPAFGAGAVGTAPWLEALFWASLSHACVPLFFMASGSLLLDPRRPLSPETVWKKRLPRLLAALFFWAFAYKLFSFWTDAKVLDLAALIRISKQTLLFRHQEHLYYLHICLLVYLFLPLTAQIANHGGEALRRYALGLWFALGILYPTVRVFWPFTSLRGIPLQWMLNMTYASIGYTLLGRAMREKSAETPRWKWALCALLGAASGALGCYLQSAGSGLTDFHFLEGMGLPMCLLALGIYGLSLGVKLPAWAERLTESLSKASFCVFLTHVFFQKALEKWGVTALIGPVALTIPALSLLLLLCGWGAYALLRRVPFVNRYLI